MRTPYHVIRVERYKARYALLLSTSGPLSRAEQEMTQYQFLTNHAQVLLCVARDPGIRLRDIAEMVGVTERSAHRILSQLVEDGYVARERVGRRNVYKVKPELPLRHSLAQETEERRIGDLLEVLLGEDGRGPARRQRQRTA